MTPIESVQAALADEPRPANVRLSVDEAVTGGVRITLFTAEPPHHTVAVLSERDLKNPEAVYLAALARHQRAVANLGGKGAA